jgi:hypothetical protein
VRKCFTSGGVVEIMRYGDVRVVIMLKRKLTKKFGIITFGQNKVS